MSNRLPIGGAERNDYATPWPVVHFLERHFGKFDLDPCCYPETAKGKTFYTAEDNALTKKWHGNVFMNPPWGQPDISQFIEYAYRQSLAGNTNIIVGLIPASSPDIHAWHNFIFKGANYIYYIRGRMPFELDGIRKNDNNVPTAIVLWKNARPGTRPRLGTFDIKNMMRG